MPFVGRSCETRSPDASGTPGVHGVACFRGPTSRAMMMIRSRLRIGPAQRSLRFARVASHGALSARFPQFAARSSEASVLPRPGPRRVAEYGAVKLNLVGRDQTQYSQDLATETASAAVSGRDRSGPGAAIDPVALRLSPTASPTVSSRRSPQRPDRSLSRYPAPARQQRSPGHAPARSRSPCPGSSTGWARRCPIYPPTTLIVEDFQRDSAQFDDCVAWSGGHGSTPSASSPTVPAGTPAAELPEQVPEERQQAHSRS